MYRFKLAAKQKDSFVFRSTKDLQKMPLENWFFLHTLFLENEAQNNKHLFLNEFEGRSVSYGPSFLPVDLCPKREARGP